jgi:glutathione synthase/RimK-type ligase-like ATP-grasp enzyme
MKLVILRRNGLGVGTCSNISQNIEGSVVINKDREVIPSSDFVLRWGTTSNIPGSPKVINKAKAIHKVFNKGVFRKLLADNNLAPQTYTDFGGFLDEHPDIWTFGKWIVRPNNHSRSENLSVGSCVREVYKAFSEYKDAYISQYIQKDREFRVFVVSGRIVAMIEKIPRDKSEVSWGCVDQGEFKYIPWTEWPLSVAQKAVGAFKLSGLDFGAADVVMASTAAYVLEINTAPEVTPYYGKCIAKGLSAILDDDIPEEVDLTSTDWRDYIHPRISN